MTQRFTMFLGISLIALNLMAQPDPKKVKKLTWEFGPMVGITTSQNDMINFTPKELHPGGAFMLRKHINNNFAVRASFLTGRISGDDKNLASHASRGYKFETPINELTLMGEYDLWGKRRNAEGAYKKMWSPYGFIGAGIALTTPGTFYNELQNATQSVNIALDKAAAKKQFITMPLGIGVKRDITNTIMFQLEGGLRWVFSDYLDGVSKSGSPGQKDTYGFLGAGVTFKLGAGKDADKDGVSDSNDLCPDIAGLESFKGCPDTDGDGVEDKKDQCPTEKGSIEMRGCPDTDSDGIADKKDECPTIAGLEIFKGCPDTDGDGIQDSKDKCPTEKGIATNAGCPEVKDTDGDGIADELDKCPTEKGVAANTGCPDIKIEDRDKDGILDKDDLCPDKAGITKFNGCPDTDGDGVEDNKDDCPTVAGSLKNNGCVEIVATDKKILEDAIYGVQFETGSSVIKTTSYGILDQVAGVMTKYPEYRLGISGHTDNTGNEGANQKLSEARARACYDYLARKNVVSNRMSHSGSGSLRPVADNKTADGRSKNRRVEFNLTTK